MLSHAEYAELWEFVFNDFKKRLRFSLIYVQQASQNSANSACNKNRC